MDSGRDSGMGDNVGLTPWRASARAVAMVAETLVTNSAGARFGISGTDSLAMIVRVALALSTFLGRLLSPTPGACEYFPPGCTALHTPH